MKTRDQYILQSRPEIPSARVSLNMCAAEQFQNKTLRPVIKFQNDLLLESFRNYTQKDKKFRNSLKGMILGQFTIEEYSFYTTNSSALNKRMMNLVIERIQENV